MERTSDVKRWLLGFWLTMMAVSTQAAGTVQVAAAADLAACMPALNDAFAKAHDGAVVRSSIGSSGTFFAQISNGAPFDVFLSADLDYPRALAQAGYADLGSLTIYAHGQLVLFTIDPDLPLGDGFKLFNHPRVKHVAIANPELAPYGRAARAALKHEDAWTGLQSRLVFGDNVAQTAQFVSTGNAQLGIVGATHVASISGGVSNARFWRIPSDWYPLIEQGGIVTRNGRANPLATQYLTFLAGEGGRAILRACGLTLPEFHK